MTRPIAHLRRLLAWTSLSILMCCVASPAGAAPKKAIWGPVATEGVSQFPIYDDLDVDLFQTQINWRLTAPTRPAVATDPNDPAYRWPADLDLAVAEGGRYGIDILVMALQTPAWANGGKTHQTPPTNPDDYAQFMEALAKRYPTVRHFMVWGEPIRSVNYRVTDSETRNYYVKSGNAKGKLKAFKPIQRREARGYAELVDATYGRVKALNRQNMIIGGNTTTSGNVDPFNWARFMRLSNGKPPRMDLFGHNPFGTRGPDLRKRQILPGTADMSDLDVFIPWIEKYQQRSGRNRKLRLFISEYTAPTDASGFEFAYFVTRKLQAQWLRAAWGITKREKLYGLGWIGLNDIVRADGEQSPTGLIDAKGVKKPSYGAFKALR